MPLHSAPSVPATFVPFALFFSVLGELERKNSPSLATFLSGSAARVDGGVVDGYLVCVIWFSDVADYLIATQESVAKAIYKSLQRVAADLGLAIPVRIVFGVTAKGE